MRLRLTAIALLVAVAGCGDDGDSPRPAATTTVTSTTTTTTAPTAPTSSAPPPPVAQAEPVVVEIRLERWSQDGTEGFEELVRETLLDPRGWQRAGFELRFSEDAPHRVLVAEGDVVDATCAPYTTGGEFSCQIGPTVALNAERWREATPTWTASLDDYRRMLVNHEVGHLLGRHHARPACEAPGAPAAVMYQQSSGLDGCQPNPWPLPWEIACAARHDEPIAPPYEPDATATCGPGDV